MENFQIVFIISICLYLIISFISSHFKNKLFEQKNNILNEKIHNLSKLYNPVLYFLIDHFVENEEYEQADACQSLIKSMEEINSIINKK